MNASLRRLASPARSPDVWLLFLLLVAAIPPILFRHQLVTLAPPLELLDHSWLVDTSYKAATGVWFGRDVAFTYGPLFQWLSSAPSRWLGVSIGSVFATWYTLPLFVVIIATFISGRLLFPPNQIWRRALFLLLAVVFWELPDVRAAVSLLAFLIIFRLVSDVASGARSCTLAAAASSVVCVSCFLLSADSGLYALAGLLLIVAATWAVTNNARPVVLPLPRFLLEFAAFSVGFMLLVNAVMLSPLNFRFWHSTLAIATSYRWVEALGMAPAGKRMLLLDLLAGLCVFLIAWRWRESQGPQPTLRPAFLLSGFCFAVLMMQSGSVRSDPGHVLLAMFPMVFLGGAVLLSGRSSAPLTSALTASTVVVLTLIFAHVSGAFLPPSIEARAEEIANPYVLCAPGYLFFDQACLQKADGELLSEISGYVDQHTNEKDSIAVFPYQTIIGLTSHRRVAGGVMQSYLVSGEYLTDLELTGLQKANPPLALYFPDGPLSPEIDGIANFTRNPQLFFYLLQNYHSVASPGAGIVGLGQDQTRKQHLQFSSQRVSAVKGEKLIQGHNAWLDLGPVLYPETGVDFLKLRLRVEYSPLWKIRKPAYTALQLIFADGSQKLLHFLVEPNRLTDVWLYPWNAPGLANYFNPDESQWRPSSQVPITALKLFVTRYDWFSVMPSSIVIDDVQGVRLSMLPNDSTLGHLR